jgi:hypothetical protein
VFGLSESLKNSGDGGGDGCGGGGVDGSDCDVKNFQVNKLGYSKNSTLQAIFFIFQLWSMSDSFYKVSLWMCKAF